MARMIPPQIDPHTASPGEREIFELLKTDPAAADWVIFHSLDIAEHSSQVSGEADFIIVIPNKGVLCVEVKGCSSLRRDEGLWYYGNGMKADPRGPFKQAAAAMHSLRTKAAGYSSQLAKIPFCSAVIFPYVELSAPSPEWHSWQLIDHRTFNGRPLAAQLQTIIERARSHMAQHTPWFSEQSLEPTREQLELLITALRPAFEAFEGPKSRAQRRNSELKHYTEEQFEALDALSENSRVLFEGPAGTGKTLLALETARRAANAGKRVLFLCFNTMLARWLESQTSPIASLATCSTIHRLMIQIAGQPPSEDIVDAAYWQTTLPNLASEILLTAKDGKFLFDELIVDEAQDLLTSRYLDIIDLCLKDGLNHGRWRFFGDFERQTIFLDPTGLAEQRRRLTEHGAVCKLRLNCRNTPRIGSLAHMLGGLNPNYKSFRRPDSGIEPNIMSYSNSTHQVALLESLLNEYSKQGVPSGDIVILSTKSDTTSAASELAKGSFRGRLSPLRVSSKGQIRYGTIHAFKGLESPVVIVTDINHVEGLEAQSLFYVAVTRPLEQLAILTSVRGKTTGNPSPFVE